MPKFSSDWDAWTSDCAPRSQSLVSRGGDVYLVIHHAYALTIQQIISLFMPGGREVSANFAMGPTTAGAHSPIYCAATVPEEMRAYTTSSFIDGQALTVEVANINLNDPYPVAMAAKERLAHLAAYMHYAYLMPLDRHHVTSHQEVHARGWGSYPTACPGRDLQDALNWIVARAQQIVNGVTPQQGDEDTMKIVPATDNVWYAVGSAGSIKIETPGSERNTNLERLREAEGYFEAGDFDKQVNIDALKVWNRYLAATSPAGGTGGGGDFPNDYAKEATVVAVGEKLAALPKPPTTDEIATKVIEYQKRPGN